MHSPRPSKTCTVQDQKHTIFPSIKSVQDPRLSNMQNPRSAKRAKFWIVTNVQDPASSKRAKILDHQKLVKSCIMQNMHKHKPRSSKTCSDHQKHAKTWITKHVRNPRSPKACKLLDDQNVQSPGSSMTCKMEDHQKRAKSKGIKKMQNPRSPKTCRNRGSSKTCNILGHQKRAQL